MGSVLSPLSPGMNIYLYIYIYLKKSFLGLTNNFTPKSNLTSRGEWQALADSIKQIMAIYNKIGLHGMSTYI